MRLHRGTLGLATLVAIAAIGTGCIGDPELETASEGIVPPLLLKKNSSRLNGPRLLSLRLRSSQLVAKDGRSQRALVVSDGVLLMAQGSGSSGPAPLRVGATIRPRVGTAPQFTINAVTPDYQYRLWMTDSHEQGLACDAEYTIALPGWWDERTGSRIASAPSDAFTLACTDAALGKCELLGYTLWDGALDAYHGACTRMIRADYCGDGQPHTVDGTGIDLWDAKSINVQNVQTIYEFEAEWTAAGAVCMSRERIESLPPPVADYIDSNCPAVASQGAMDACGQSFNDATQSIMMNSDEI